MLKTTQRLVTVAIFIMPLVITRAQQRSTAPVLADRAKLIAERDYDLEQLRFHEAMLTHSSFAERTDLFCRDSADSSLANHLPSFSHGASNQSLHSYMAESRDIQNQNAILESIPHGPYGVTLSDLKTEYARLTRDKPPTREAEMKRQQELNAIKMALADYAKELDACHTAIVFGPVPLPTDDAMRTAAKRERERIAQIDQELHKAVTAPSKSPGH